MSLILLPGVDPSNIRPELMLALIVAEGVYAEQDSHCYVTSLNDSRHSSTSLHYAGAAADLRTKNLHLGVPITVRSMLRKRLPRHYDVLLEDRGKANEHIHIEWQRRMPR